MAEAAQKEVEDEIIDDDDFELDIVDDTPEEDQDRPVAPVTEGEEYSSEIPEEPDEEELKSYSEKVRERISKMTARNHAERRAKEQVARQLEEAASVAKRVIQENNQLKKLVHQGESVWKNTNEHRLTSEIERARRDYKTAYEEGDADLIADAQTRLTQLHVELDKTKSWTPQEMPAQEEPQFNAPQSQQQQVDEKAQNWQKKNSWFGKDVEMTGTALGIHQKLVSEGVSPEDPVYYTRIDSEIRKRFPEKFKPDNGSSQPSGGRSVVAPATRASGKSPRKVTLTASQVALAKKLGVTPKQYAEQMLKDQNND